MVRVTAKGLGGQADLQKVSLGLVMMRQENPLIRTGNGETGKPLSHQ